MPMANTRANLRNDLRDKRRAISDVEQHLAGRRLFFRLANHPMLARSQRCAFYLPQDGEISPMMLMYKAMQNGSVCYLPRISATNQMEFRYFQPGQRLEKNRFGIFEPSPRNDMISVDKLDIVFMPLVAFDGYGNRLGMGGGYYDRSFAFRRKCGRRALLVGLAHDCQHVDKLAPQPWDVPLDYVATATRLISPSS